MILIILAILVAVAVTLVTVKAHRWDYTKSLFDAQQAERLQASQLSATLLRYFDRLDVLRKGVLTAEHISAVDVLQISAADKALLIEGLRAAGPRVHYADNPWMLAPVQTYELTPVGHVIGKRQEHRVAVAGMHGGAYAYRIDVDAYGISKADLESYVARVNARKQLTVRA